MYDDYLCYDVKFPDQSQSRPDITVIDENEECQPKEEKSEEMVVEEGGEDAQLLCEYERERLQRITKNNKLLLSLVS